MRQNIVLFSPALAHPGFVIIATKDDAPLTSIGHTTTLSSSIFIITSAFVNRIEYTCIKLLA